MRSWKVVPVFVLLLISTVVIYRRTKSVVLTVYTSRSSSMTQWTALFRRTLTKPSLRTERPTLSHLLNDSTGTRTTVVLSNRTNGSQLELWTEMGCQSSQPLLACTVSDKNKSPDFKVATRDVFYDNRVLHVRSDSCSLVGSAGWLLNRSYGEDIDSHQLVVRLNTSPVRGFERYVGKRPADITIVQKAVKGCPPDISNATLVLRLYRHVNNRRQAKECMDRYSLPIYAVGGTAFSLSQGVLQDYRRVVNGYNTTVFPKSSFPTTGLMSAIFCLQICKELHIYGFGWRPGDLYSYYRNNTHFDSTVHNYYVESTFLKHLSTGEYRNVLRRKLPLQGNWTVYWHD